MFKSHPLFLVKIEVERGVAESGDAVGGVVVVTHTHSCTPLSLAKFARTQLDFCVSTLKNLSIQPYKCLFALIILATYWTAEVTPLAVTSLIPMFLFPTLGLLPAARTAQHYFKVSHLVTHNCYTRFRSSCLQLSLGLCNYHLTRCLTFFTTF